VAKTRTPSQKGKMSRTKGLAFEREVAILLRAVYPEARRQLEYQEGLGVDISGTGAYRFQCKRGRKYAPLSMLEEAEDGVGIPVLVTKADHKGAVAALRFEDFLHLLKLAKETFHGSIERQRQEVGEESSSGGDLDAAG
jgi:hypothetical protein